MLLKIVELLVVLIVFPAIFVKMAAFFELKHKKLTKQNA
jgi:hypothetical protein